MRCELGGVQVIASWDTKKCLNFMEYKKSHRLCIGISNKQIILVILQASKCDLGQYWQFLMYLKIFTGWSESYPFQ